MTLHPVGGYFSCSRTLNTIPSLPPKCIDLETLIALRVVSLCALAGAFFGMPAAAANLPPVPVHSSVDSSAKNSDAVESVIQREFRQHGESKGPDVFGSVALAVPGTSLDGRWKRVVNASARGALLAFGRSLEDRSLSDRIDEVNRYVNHHVNFSPDSSAFKNADHWSTANETLLRGKGDCEDYAIAKFQILREAGIAANDLYFVIVRDMLRHADHAVVVVRTDGGMRLLDSGTDRIVEAVDTRQYRPILSYSANHAWIHGYEIPIRPTQSSQATPILAISLIKGPLILPIRSR